MLYPPNVLKLVKMLELLRIGAGVDEVLVNGAEASNIEGTFKLIDNETLTIESIYDLPKKPKQRVEVIYKWITDASEVRINGTVQKIVSIKVQHDFNITLNAINFLVEARLKYSDAAGVIHSLYLLSEDIKLNSLSTMSSREPDTSNPLASE